VVNKGGGRLGNQGMRHLTKKRERRGERLKGGKRQGCSTKVRKNRRKKRSLRIRIEKVIKPL